jgi:hypothetical protein
MEQFRQTRKEIRLTGKLLPKLLSSGSMPLSTPPPAQSAARRKPRRIRPAIDAKKNVQNFKSRVPNALLREAIGLEAQIENLQLTEPAEGVI